MEELLKKLEISEDLNPLDLLNALKDKQTEHKALYVSVEDENKKKQIKETLNSI